MSHPDRVLFGIDEFPPAAENYAIYLRFLETADEHFAHSAEEVPLMGRWAISGLDLPQDVLRTGGGGQRAPDRSGVGAMTTRAVDAGAACAQLCFADGGS